MRIQLSPLIKKFLIFYVVAFVLQHAIDQFFGGNLKSWFALIPAQVASGKIWQILTYSFLHADVTHLVLNGLVLAFIGSEIERAWGSRRFLFFYLGCSILAGFMYLAIQLVLWNPLYLSLPMVGASGGIYGLMMAYAILYPNREMLFMMMFPMNARQFMWVLAGIEFLHTLFSGQGGLSALAHLSGMGAGYGLMWLQGKGFQFSFPKKSVKPRRQSSHLKLVKEDDEPRDPRKWH